MARIDLVALQQRMAQQQPKPMPAEPPSWSTRPAPASALRTTPASKARPAAASAAAPEGTLRATTTMRAALPLKAPNTRAERAEERARANALRVQLDELNAAMVADRAEADRTLAEERQRADRLNEQVKALLARAQRAEADRDAERDRADALRDRLDGLQHDLMASEAIASELKARQAIMTEVHGRELAMAQHDAQTGQQAAAALRQAEVARKARGPVARLRAAWRGE